MTSDKSAAFSKAVDGIQAHDPMTDQQGARALAEFASRNAARRQRRVWSRRVASWDQHGSAGLAKVTAAVLNAADAPPGARVVDLGCGNGQLGLAQAWWAHRDR